MNEAPASGGLFDRMTDDLTRLGLVDDEEIDLDEAALTLALLDHPEVDPQPYVDLIDTIAAAVEEEGADADTASERAAVLAHVVADTFGFFGDVDSYDDPDNADLVRVIDRRRGLPVALSILYVAAARRAGWLAAALDVPGHVLVLVGDEAAPVIVDPFRGGITVAAEELAAMLDAQADPGSPPVRHVAAMSNRAVLVRLLVNQATRAEANGRGRRALTLYRRMTTIAPDHVQAWWECARLELVDGDVENARRRLGTILEITREPDLRRRVTDLLTSLPAA